MSARTPTIVLGGTGYVAGELLRLIAGHPRLELAGVLSDSQPGTPAPAAFPQLRSVYPTLVFSSLEQLESSIRRTPDSALFCAAPHGAAAGIIDRLLTAAETGGTRTRCGETSADLFYPTGRRP